MTLYERIIAKEEKVSLVGLGYVGMPIAVAFATLYVSSPCENQNMMMGKEY